MHPWFIYLITTADGSKYVGATRNMKRRMKEHRKSFGRDFTFEIMETGHTIEWRSAEHRWIEKMRVGGVALSNQTSGRNGVESLNAESRARLSKAQKGKPKPNGFGAKVGAAQKGVPKGLSEEGRARLRESGKKSAARWAALSDEEKAAHSRRGRERWEAVPPEDRERHEHRSRERATKTWASRSIEERSDIGFKIAASRARSLNAEERSEIASANASKMYAGDPTAARRIGDRIRQWWASLTPEEREAQIERRRATREAKRQAKNERGGG